MADDLSTVTTSATALSNLILVSPQATIGYQPQNAPSKSGQVAQQPPAILFHYEGEQSVTLESDITDNYVEDNTAINDQIALRPEMVTTQGFIGELNDIAPRVLEPLKIISEKLTIIGAYTPSLSATAILAYNEAAFIYSIGKNALNSAVAAWSSISGSGGESVINGNGIITQSNQNKQQVAFQQFYGYWKNRTLFTVQTPWAVFQNMAIKSLRAVQDAETNVITDVEVTFKIMRFASTISQSTPISLRFEGRSAFQASSLTNLGTSTPAFSPIPFLSNVRG